MSLSLLENLGSFFLAVTTTFLPGKWKKGAVQSRERSFEKTYLLG